jgi:hypothetical protein
MGSVSLFAQDRLTIDLKTLPLTRNATAFTKNWDDLLIEFPAWPASVNWTNFNRVVVKVKYFDADNKEIAQSDSRVQVVLIYDPKGDIRGPENGPGPNTPLKVQNVGGGSSSISRDTGTALRLTQAPGAILFQNNTTAVRFIEVTEITFFKR